MINKEPIYQQLNQLLKELINQGEYEIGTRFLTERTICKRYEVSRATANKAISNLVSEGVLEYRRGIGTFIKGLPRTEEYRSITGFTENVTRAGKTPTTRVLKLERMKAGQVSPGLVELLQISPEDEIYRIERLRLADDTPMMLEQRVITARYCPDLFEHSLTGSLYELLQREYHLNLSGADERIQATVIGERESELLEIEQGQAAFRIITLGFVNDDRPLWWEETLHRPDAIEFRCRVRSQGGDRKLRERLLLDEPRLTF